jgi:HlyD family secretion protein
VRLASRYGGRVVALGAKEGDAVTNGQMIVELDADELTARRALLAAQLKEQEAGPRTQEIEEARSDWEAQSAQLEQAKSDARRAEELFAQKTISSAEREQPLTRERTLEKNVAAARSRYDLLLAGTRPERIAQTRAQLAELDTQFKELRITAPTNSVLETLSVKVGDVASTGRDVATLLLTNHLWVRVYVPEPWLGHIKIGEQARVRVDSEPGRDFTGIVQQIARTAEFTPRNVQTAAERVKQMFGIKVALDASSGALRAGMAADVFFANTPR